MTDDQDDQDGRDAFDDIDRSLPIEEQNVQAAALYRDEILRKLQGPLTDREREIWMHELDKTFEIQTAFDELIEKRDEDDG